MLGLCDTVLTVLVTGVLGHWYSGTLFLQVYYATGNGTWTLGHWPAFLQVYYGTGTLRHWNIGILGLWDTVLQVYYGTGNGT